MCNGTGITCMCNGTGVIGMCKGTGVIGMCNGTCVIGIFVIVLFEIDSQNDSAFSYYINDSVLFHIHQMPQILVQNIIEMTLVP
jgi:hypothetical protein